MPFSRKPLRALVSTVLFGATMPVSAGTLSFSEVPVPADDAEKRAVLASDSATVDGRDIEIGFKNLMRSGQGFDVNEETEFKARRAIRGSKDDDGDDDDDDGARGQLPFGTLIDNAGSPIPGDDRNPLISNSNDFNSLIPHDDMLFMISQFESRPAAMYISGLDQDPATGELTALWTRPIDFSEVRGGWVHCAGSVTPWNTHLGGEEYEPDARLVDPVTGTKVQDDGATEDGYYHAMDGYVQGDRTQLNPYDYGYPVEVSVENEAGDTDVKKHYAMGRTALELAYAMPDEKTAYLTDDGRMVGFFMFVADRKKDLRAGTLYAARWEQTSADGVGLGEANLSWINLGHASDDEIAAYLTGPGKATFGDIFDAAIPNADGSCNDHYRLVAKGHRKTAGETYAECLKLKPGMDKAASRLETRRYAALMGATTEFNKEEGITYDPDTKRLYIAMSDVTDGMLDNDATEQFNGFPAGPNDIRVSENRCGAVYGADLSKRPRDTNGRKIKSKFVATNMYPVVAGDTASGTDADNSCNVGNIASPDNISYLPGYRILIIGEDTSRHQNDVVWSYDTRSGDLTRIQTTPYGSETTSVYWYPNIKGFGYLMSVIQHPFGESAETQYVNESLADRGYSGYIGPFPALE